MTPKLTWGGRKCLTAWRKIWEMEERGDEEGHFAEAWVDLGQSLRDRDRTSSQPPTPHPKAWVRAGASPSPG